MAQGKLKNNIAFTLAILGFIVSIVVLLFGDSLLLRSSGAELSIKSSTSDFQLPDKLKKIISNNVNLDELQLIPDTIRIVNLRNDGSTSRNLKVVLDLDGPVYQNKVTSTDDVTLQITDQEIVTISMDRLSKHAEVSMIFWVRNENREFIAKYSDDNKSGLINVNSAVNENQSKTNIISLLLAIISLSVVFYQLIKMISIKFKTTSYNSNKDLLEEVLNMYQKNNKNNDSLSDLESGEEKDDEIDPKEELMRMMERLKKVSPP
ncbi:hypothetical protein P4H66_27920 [Paenibacillus dokdonensis]|uniref:Uncharacterized protein n=1 Tax=Paenibacillus dokdonensis TaxID=2567944 RepID=A0ABU6GW76_9BACL|nr:hypothetical protein [Paenibacillus dokdonensis]MEC0243643.1 hypothetical protein [Paenibacillus dokdonensis]